MDQAARRSLATRLRTVASPAGLGRLLASRTGVLALTTGGTLVVRTGSSIVLTRLLSPAAFGTVGIINSIFFALGLLTDLGFQSFVVRHARGDERHFGDVIWTIHASRGAMLWALAAGGAPVFAWALGKPELALPLAVAGGTFFLNGLTSLSLMTALRRDGARKLSLLDLLFQAFQSLAAILLAWWWRSLWAIIAAMLLQGLFRLAMSYVLFPDTRHRLARDPSIRREFLAFSRVVLASSSLTFLLAQSDKIALARLLTLPQFGLYAIAISLAAAPAAFVDAYVSRVTFPAFAATFRAEPHRLGEVYYGAGRVPALLYGFACGGLIGSAGLLIRLLYDPRYVGAGLYLSLLAIASAMRFPTFSAAELMTATGRIKGTLYANVLRVLWLFAAGTAGFLTLGIVGVIAAVGLVEVPALLYSWWELRRLAVLRLGREFAYLATVAAGATVGLAGSTLLLRLIPHL